MKGQFLLTVLSSTRQGVLDMLDFTAPSVVEVQMFLHSIAILENSIEAMTLKYPRSYKIRKLYGFTVQNI